MIHFKEEIQRDHLHLSQDALIHIDTCPECRVEYRIMTSIEHGIAGIPLLALPRGLRDQIFARVLRPVYQIWHLLAGALFAIAGPFVLARAMDPQMQFGERTLAALFAGYGVLLVALSVPLAHYLLSSHRSRVGDFEKEVDELLDHPLKELGRLIKRTH